MKSLKLLQDTFGFVLASVENNEDYRQIVPLFQHFQAQCGEGTGFEIDHDNWYLILNHFTKLTTSSDIFAHPMPMVLVELINAGANRPPATLTKEAFLKPYNACMFLALLVADKEYFFRTDSECHWVDVAYQSGSFTVVKTLEELGLTSSSDSIENLKKVLISGFENPLFTESAAQLICYMLQKGHLSADTNPLNTAATVSEFLDPTTKKILAITSSATPEINEWLLRCAEQTNTLSHLTIAAYLLGNDCMIEFLYARSITLPCAEDILMLHPHLDFPDHIRMLEDKAKKEDTAECTHILNRFSFPVILLIARRALNGDTQEQKNLHTLFQWASHCYLNNASPVKEDVLQTLLLANLSTLHTESYNINFVTLYMQAIDHPNVQKALWQASAYADPEMPSKTKGLFLRHALATETSDPQRYAKMLVDTILPDTDTKLHSDIYYSLLYCFELNPDMPLFFAFIQALRDGGLQEAHFQYLTDTGRYSITSSVSRVLTQYSEGKLSNAKQQVMFIGLAPEPMRATILSEAGNTPVFHEQGQAIASYLCLLWNASPYDLLQLPELPENVTCALLSLM